MSASLFDDFIYIGVFLCQSILMGASIYTKTVRLFKKHRALKVWHAGCLSMDVRCLEKYPDNNKQNNNKKTKYNHGKDYRY